MHFFDEFSDFVHGPFYFALESFLLLLNTSTWILNHPLIYLVHAACSFYLLLLLLEGQDIGDDV